MEAVKRSRPRVSRRDWVEAAYQELVKAGEPGVGINALAARLGVTKGSFYWHFRDRSELLRALLDRWAHERTGEVLSLALGTTSDPRERLRRVLLLGREVAPLDRAMRLWAQHDPEAAEAVRLADRTLLDHLAGSLTGVGFPEPDARIRALLMLRAWVGGYLVPSPDEDTPQTDPDDLLDIFLGRPGERPLSIFS
ncbi:TetR/AcrR family transcriptional regulator [Actinocorallia sp. B10E7]|uniref:TetR/AcrR family transcriptional regulator n=1 Tax=Actinocorallia sp. B10E7 TaxID=3153558 RepID=UPI00325E92C5